MTALLVTTELCDNDGDLHTATHQCQVCGWFVCLAHSSEHAHTEQQ